MKRLLSILIFTFLSVQVSAQSVKELNSSLKHLSDSQRIDSLYKLGRAEFIQGDSTLKVQQVLRFVVNQVESRGIGKVKPKARYYLARNFAKNSQNDSAIYHLTLCIREIKKEKIEDWLPYPYGALINVYRNVGNYEKAIDIGYEALSEFEKRNDTLDMADIYTEIGYVYDRMKEFKEAIVWHKKALALVDSVMYSDFYNFIEGRIAIAFDDQAVYDSAHYYNFRNLNYYIKVNDSTGIGIVSSNIGNTFNKQEEWDKAAEILSNSVQILQIKGDEGFKAISKINYGTALMHLDSFKLSKTMLREGLKHAQVWGGKKFESEAYFRFYEMYQLQNEYDSALFYFKKHKELEDELYDLNKMNQINTIKTQYETEKKEQQIEIQKASIAEQESELKAKQRTILALTIFCILIIFIAFAAYKRYQAKKNAEVQQRIIQEQEKGLKAVFFAQEEERKRISKDLHDGIGQQLSGLKMALQNRSSKLKDKLPEEAAEFEKLAKIASESANEVRSISHSMMPRALTELGLIDAIADLLEKSLGITNIKYEFEHYGIKGRLSEQVEVSLYRIAQELINNIIKHSSANKVSVQLFKNKSRIILIVEDNGTGIGSSNTDGHGLLNMKSRINTLNGEMNLEPSPNSGTLATVRIPV